MAKRNRTNYKKRIDSTEIGFYGLPISNGKLKEDTIRKLRGVRKIKVLEEMVSFDPTIGAFNNMYQSTASTVNWFIKPKDDSEEAKGVAKFIESCFFEDLGHPFQDLISNAMTASQYGFSLIEPVYKMRNGEKRDKEKSSIFNDGMIGLSKLASRYQGSITKWNYDEGYRHLVSVTQRNPNDYVEVEIPYSKLLHFRFRSLNNSPEGKSLYYNCVEPYMKKRDISVLETIRYEKGYSGLLVSKVPSQILDPNTKNPAYIAIQKWLKDTLQNLRDGTSTGVALPEYIDLTTIGDTQGMPNADDIIAREDRNIAVALLSDFFLSTQKSGVSGSFSQSKIKIFINLVKEMLEEIKQVINSQLIPSLLEKNLIDLKLAPEIQYSEIGDLDMTNMMLLLQSAKANKLVPANVRLCNLVMKRVFGNDAPQFTEDEYRDYLALEEVNTVAYATEEVAQETVDLALESNEE